VTPAHVEQLIGELIEVLPKFFGLVRSVPMSVSP
jgi:hypothetical protein